MNGKKESNWLKRIITGLVLLASNLIAGAALGLLWVKLFVPQKAMGWDGIADVLGGMMGGALLGVVVTVLMVALLSVRVQWVWIGIIVVAAGLNAIVLQQVISESTRTFANPTPTLVGTSIPAPTPMLKRASITFKGKVSRGQVFEEVLSDDLVFRLDPLQHGWEIWLGDRSATEHNFSGVATPPFHGVNARHVEGWHFRNSDNSGPNELGDRNVNAPQQERRFCYVLNEGDFQTSANWLNEQLLAKEEWEEHDGNSEKVQRQSGLLTITKLTLGNLKAGEQAWIETSAIILRKIPMILFGYCKKDGFLLA